MISIADTIEGQDIANFFYFLNPSADTLKICLYNAGTRFLSNPLGSSGLAELHYQTL